MAMVKNSIQPNSNINITLTDQNGEKLTYKVRRDRQLSTMMRGYCERKRLDYRATNFIYGGKRINAKQTPNILEMKDNAGITVMAHVNGGGCCAGGPVMVVYDYRWV